LQNVDNNTFELAQNVTATIKQECEIVEIEANCPIQMQTTSSNLNNYEEIVVGVERSSQNIELDDEMDLDRDEENGKRLQLIHQNKFLYQNFSEAHSIEHFNIKMIDQKYIGYHKVRDKK
jgi:hypothetical protein